MGLDIIPTSGRKFWTPTPSRDSASKAFSAARQAARSVRISSPGATAKTRRNCTGNSWGAIRTRRRCWCDRGWHSLPAARPPALRLCGARTPAEGLEQTFRLAQDQLGKVQEHRQSQEGGPQLHIGRDAASTGIEDAARLGTE